MGCCRGPSLASTNLPGDANASTQATLYFARALGASRLGDIKAAQAALQPLLSLRDALAQSGDGDANQVNIELKIVSAWIKWADGNHDAAVQEMRTATAMDDATEKSPVSPGSIAPAPEMLGDMLLSAKQPKLALAAYESALKSTPGRPRAEYGAAVSAREQDCGPPRSGTTAGCSRTAATPIQIFRNSPRQITFSAKTSSVSVRSLAI